VQSVVNGLALLSFLGVVILMLGGAAMLRSIKDLQQAVLRPPVASSSARIALPGHDPRLVLVVDDDCTGCIERVADLNRLLTGDAAFKGFRVLLLASRPAVAGWPTAPGLTALIDPGLVGSLAVVATPTSILFDGSGRELSRRAIGSEDELREVLHQAGQLESSK
jgi:hypothetical protein